MSHHYSVLLFSMYGKKDHGNEKYHKQARNDIPPMRREGFGDQTRCEHQEYPDREANKPCRGMRCTLHRAPPGLDGCQTQTVYALNRTYLALVGRGNFRIP